MHLGRTSNQFLIINRHDSPPTTGQYVENKQPVPACPGYYPSCLLVCPGRLQMNRILCLPAENQPEQINGANIGSRMKGSLILCLSKFRKCFLGATLLWIWMSSSDRFTIERTFLWRISENINLVVLQFISSLLLERHRTNLVNITSTCCQFIGHRKYYPGFFRSLTKNFKIWFSSSSHRHRCLLDFIYVSRRAVVVF